MITVKSPTVQERAQLIELSRVCRAETDLDINPDYFKDFPEFFFSGIWDMTFNKPAQNLAKVAYNDNVPVGFCSVGDLSEDYLTLLKDFETQDCGELHQIYILRAHQHSGLGKHLYKEALKALHNLGHKNFILCTYSNNDKACAFYEHMGCVCLQDMILPVKGLTKNWQIPVRFYKGKVAL